MTGFKERALRSKIEQLNSSLVFAEERIQELEKENREMRRRLDDREESHVEEIVNRLKADYEEGILLSKEAKKKYEQMSKELTVLKAKYNKDMAQFRKDFIGGQS